VLDEIIEHGRWHVTHRRIFRHDGKFYKTFYRVGATEHQNEHPYEYESDEIECPEVVAVQRLVTVYEPVDSGAAQGEEKKHAE
jgi:hypothetical protein